MKFSTEVKDKEELSKFIIMIIISPPDYLTWLIDLSRTGRVKSV